MNSSRPTSIPSPIKGDKIRPPEAKHVPASAGFATDSRINPGNITGRVPERVNKDLRSLQQQNITSVPRKLAGPSRSASLRQPSKTGIPRTGSVQDGSKESKLFQRPRPLSVHLPSTTEETTKAPKTIGRYANEPTNGATGTRPSAPTQHSRSRSVTTIGGPSFTKPPSVGATRGGPILRPKPQFTTYQQHFSPRKPTPTPVASSEPVLNSADETETNKLQDELLQLQLLANVGHRNLRLQRSSTTEVLQRQRESTEKLLNNLNLSEAEVASASNRKALGQWLLSEDASDVTRKSKELSSCVHSLQELSSPSGRASRILNEFDAWLIHVRHLWDSREKAAQDVLGFVQPLSASWKDDLAVLLRQLLQIMSRLESLGEAEASSAIGRVLAAHRGHTMCLLDELQCAKDLETSIIEAERQWGDSEVRDLLERQEECYLSINMNTPAAWQRNSRSN